MNPELRFGGEPMSDREMQAKISKKFKDALGLQGIDLIDVVKKDTDAQIAGRPDSGVRVAISGDLNLMDERLSKGELPSRLDVKGDMVINVASLDTLSGKSITVDGALEIIVPGLMKPEDMKAVEDKAYTLDGVVCGSVKVTKSKFTS